MDLDLDLVQREVRILFSIRLTDFQAVVAIIEDHAKGVLSFSEV